MNKKVLLVGCGSEIGSMLLSMNQQLKDKFIIDTVLTNKISNMRKVLSPSRVVFGYEGDAQGGQTISRNVKSFTPSGGGGGGDIPGGEPDPGGGPL